MPTKTWVSRASVRSLTGNTTNGSAPASYSYFSGNCEVVSASNGPDWQDKLRRNPVLCGSMSASINTYQIKPSSHVITVRSGKNPPVSYWSYGDVQGFEDTWRLATASLTGGADSVASSQLIDRFQDAIQDVQSGPIIGELGSTLQTVNDLRRSAFNVFTTPLRRYPTAVSSFMRRRKGYRTSDFLKWSSNYWLKWRFALLPLVRDMNDLATAFNNKSRDFKYEYLVFKATGQKSMSYAGPIYQAGSGLMKFLTGYREFADCTVKYRGAVGTRGQGSDLKRYGLTQEEFLPTLWEITPYSWLIDYATNTGDVIRTWSYRHTFDAGLQKTVAQVLRGEIYGRRPNTKDFLPLGLTLESEAFSSGTWRKESKIINRTVVQKLTVPNITFSIPGAPSLRDLRWVNVAAFLIPKLIQRSVVARSKALQGARK